MKAGLIVALDTEYEALRRSGVTDVVRSGITGLRRAVF